MIIRLSFFISGCILGCKQYKHLIINIICGAGGTLWKILSNEYRPTLLKKNEPGDYILWALNHPTEFENTYNGTLKKLVRGR